jgi:hypothetical protein
MVAGNRLRAQRDEEVTERMIHHKDTENTETKRF